MGVDVNLYAQGVVTDDELVAANAYLTEHLGEHDEHDEWLSRSDSYDTPRVEFCTWNRYYGPGYERGPWPTIYGHIRALRAALPKCAIHYGGDSDEWGVECDDAYLEEIWQHWLGPDGQAYRRPRA